MLYFRALTAALRTARRMPDAPRDRGARQREGWPALHAELSGVDPESAARSTAMTRRDPAVGEVHRISGRSCRSCRRGASPPTAVRHAAGFARALRPGGAARAHQRVSRRCSPQGLVGEGGNSARVKRSTRAMPSMRAVGYRQVWETLAGEKPAGPGRPGRRRHATTREAASHVARAMPGVERFRLPSRRSMRSGGGERRALPQSSRGT